MRLAMKLPSKDQSSAVANDVDPRESENLDVIDLASRNAYPVVAGKKGKADGLGMVAGIALVAGLGMVTLWSMSSARLEKPAAVGNPNVVAQQGPIAPFVVPPPGAPAPAPPVAMVQADPAPSPVYAVPPAAAVAVVPAANPYASPTVVFDAGAGTVTATPGVAEAVAAATGNSANDFASRVG